MSQLTEKSTPNAQLFNAPRRLNLKENQEIATDSEEDDCIVIKKAKKIVNMLEDSDQGLRTNRKRDTKKSKNWTRCRRFNTFTWPLSTP